MTSVGGRKSKGPKDLAKLIASYSPNDKAAISVWRDGSVQDIEVKLGTLPSGKKLAGKPRKTEEPEDLVPLETFGFALTNSDDGVLIAKVEPDSAAAKKGFRKGNIILSVNGTEVTSVGEVEDALADAISAKRKAVLFQIKAGSNNRFVALPIAKG